MPPVLRADPNRNCRGDDAGSMLNDESFLLENNIDQREVPNSSLGSSRAFSMAGEMAPLGSTGESAALTKQTTETGAGLGEEVDEPSRRSRRELMEVTVDVSRETLMLAEELLDDKVDGAALRGRVFVGFGRVGADVEAVGSGVLVAHGGARPPP
jgi:hypothetical protein